MTSYTRRGALAAMAAGGLYLITDTDAFSSSEANRQTDIGARDDGSALLGLSGVDTNEVYTDLPHEIELTNRLEETLEVTLLSRNDRFNFPSQSGSDKTFITVTLTPGVSENVSVSTDETGTVSEKISFEAVSPTGSRTIELVREIALEGAVEVSGQCLFTQKQGKKLQTISNASAAGKVQVSTLLSSPNIKAIGASDIDGDNDGESDAVFIRKGNNILLTDSNDSDASRKLKTKNNKPKKQKAHMSTGSFDGSTGVFYVSNGKIYRVAVGSGPVLVANPNNGAGAVAGIGDIDGDGTDELAFADGSQTVRYVTPQDSTVESFASTGVTAGSSNNVGVGAPADFDDDGTASVPVVDGSNQVVLVGPGGIRRTLISGGNNQAAKSPVCPSDPDGDGNLEVVYIRNGGKQELQSVGLDGTVETLKDSNGKKIPADKKRGVTSFG